MEISEIKMEKIQNMANITKEMEMKSAHQPKHIHKNNHMFNVKNRKDNGDNKSIMELLEKKIKSNNELLKMFNQSIRFEIDKRTNEIVIKIVDKETGELIRQIPPEELLKLEARLKEITGILYNKKI